MMEKELLNSEQAANYLGLATQTLANWRFLNKGPAYLCIGRRRMYQLEDLDNFKQRNRIEPESMQ